ncbi:hypothetical protein AY599_23635 [Leptolyngbya valderiana BDU 20041]|nr:hypothetical protein AY599_23635 [Leptolyngbya valderiana BDU 20041]
MHADRRDFSPAMLRVFLTGRAVRRKWTDGVTGASARARTVADLKHDTGLSRAVIANAFRGRVADAATLALLWGALGHDDLPASSGGGSSCASRLSDAQRALAAGAEVRP